MVATCCPALRTAASPVEHEEALGAHVALVDEQGPDLGVHDLAQGGDLLDVGLVHVGQEREAAEIVDDRLIDLA